MEQYNMKPLSFEDVLDLGQLDLLEQKRWYLGKLRTLCVEDDRAYAFSLAYDQLILLLRDLFIDGGYFYISRSHTTRPGSVRWALVENKEIFNNFIESSWLRRRDLRNTGYVHYISEENTIPGLITNHKISNISGILLGPLSAIKELSHESGVEVEAKDNGELVHHIALIGLGYGDCYLKSRELISILYRSRSAAILEFNSQPYNFLSHFAHRYLMLKSDLSLKFLGSRPITYTIVARMLSDIYWEKYGGES